MLGALRRPRIPILYYHEVGAERSKHVVTPADFEAQLDLLSGEGFEPLSLDDLAAIYTRARRAPARGVVLTFDDGRAGVRDHAAPALARRGWPAALYLVTGWLDGGTIPEIERYSGFVGWRDLPELAAAGFTLGSHTVSHRALKRLPPEEIEAEVAGSRRRLEDALGRAVDHFSFPYGRRSREAARAVRDAGYRTAVVTGERTNGDLARLHRLFRLRVDGRASLAAFRTRLLAATRRGLLPFATRVG